MILRPRLALALALLFPASTFAQTPDRRGELVTDTPTYQGRTASAPIPARLHVRNEGGSDGAGLCVISSILCDGMFQAVPGLESPGHDEASGQSAPGKGSGLWRAAKGARGGYSPDKLASLVNRIMPGEDWASYVGTDPSILDRLSRMGYAIGVTMNTGALYGYRPIHHMVSLVHFRADDFACVVDNNDPGKFHWMPADEFLRRWIDGGTGWAWIWLRRASLPQGLPLPLAIFLCTAGATACVVSGGALSWTVYEVFLK